MADFTAGENLCEATFSDVDLRGAKFNRCYLSNVVMRGVEIAGADIDAPWLSEDGSPLLVNGVDVAPFVEAELNRRFPGRELRDAFEPAGLRAAWASLQETWDHTLAYVATLPPGAVDVSVAGEWSFSQTLRHLVMATDVWLGRAIFELDEPYHPLGQPHAEYATDGYDLSVFATGTPEYGDVLAARASRVAMVRDFLTTLTTDELSVARRNPWAPDHGETTLSCLHTIFNEEWEHHRFAVRDLAVVTGTP